MTVLSKNHWEYKAPQMDYLGILVKLKIHLTSD
jgi:hypothetical protein